MLHNETQGRCGCTRVGSQSPLLPALPYLTPSPRPVSLYIYVCQKGRVPWCLLVCARSCARTRKHVCLRAGTYASPDTHMNI